MTEFPELQAALVDAAGRRRPRRGWRLVGVLVPAAAAVVLVVTVGRSPDVEQPAPPAKPRPRLEQHFGVFRRPRTAADRLPTAVAQPHLRAQRSRLVAELGDRRFYLVPAAHDSLCLVEIEAGGAAGSECAPAASAADESRPIGEYGPRYLVYVLPDGTHDVLLTDRDGRLARLFPRDNAIAVEVSRRPRSLTWVGPSGEPHGTVLGRIDIGRPDCAALGPRLAEATARNAALIAVRTLYPGVTNPRVVSVKPAGANAGGCGPRTEGRVLLVDLRFDPGVKSASLSQGRVLVGSVAGRTVVWRLH